MISENPHTAFDIIERYVSSSEPIKIEFLIEELGLVLDKNADLPQDIAGQIEQLENGIYKISVNKNDHYFRKRFTIAHEVAHFLFHKKLMKGRLQDNRLYREPDLQRQISEKHEIEANKFAVSLLMPRRHVLRDFEAMGKDIKRVASKWQASPKAISIRLGLPY